MWYVAKAKDAAARLSAVEAAGRDGPDTVDNDELDWIDQHSNSEPISDWCCITRVLSLQSDFAGEKPLIQTNIEKRGHICEFLPKFHCKLNPKEMVWGFAKYRKFTLLFTICTLTAINPGFRAASDGKFATSRNLVPVCLDACSLHTIWRFFRKTWQYMNAYRYESFLT